MARLWRDAGFPQLGLADAHRAVYFAPASPEARNTLGTILQALGHRQLARQEYERALKMNPKASYALNNLCYVSLLDGNATMRWRCAVAPSTQSPASTRRTTISRSSTRPRATTPRRSASSQRLATTPRCCYNTGIVHLARREYRSAVEGVPGCACAATVDDECLGACASGGDGSRRRRIGAASCPDPHCQRALRRAHTAPPPCTRASRRRWRRPD